MRRYRFDLRSRCFVVARDHAQNHGNSKQTHDKAPFMRAISV